ncbi:AMP-binding protein [Halarcobacter sp.]|uniref:AMP-binding protein n=1 Tax=Halarcobacter sp. TaxID=2321133 RepID=UPI002AA7CD02|nr:AMP-binding protein [Halarcobacter sp.]
MNKCLALKIEKVLSSSNHEWQYCFLERGGDRGEVYLSPKEILALSKEFAYSLIQYIPANSKLILLLEHGPNFLITLIACIFAGITVIPTTISRFGLNSLRLGKIIKICDGSFILTHDNKIESIKSLFKSDDLFNINNVLTIESLSNTTKVNKSLKLPGFEISQNQPVIIQFTSGTTSEPKGVLISSENILANYYKVASKWNFRKEKTLLTWLPHFHDMGLFGGLFYPLLSGQKIVQMDPLHFIQKPQRWLYAISKFKVNFTGGPAFSFELCNELDIEKFNNKLDLSSLEVAFCGADYVPSKTLNSFRKIFSQFHLNPLSVTPVYGLAEATLFVSGEPNFRFSKPQIYKGNYTEGCYLGEEKNLEIKIVDLYNDNVLSNGEIGEIIISGNSITQGYYEKESFYPSKRFRTGDLGFISNNHLFITGRKKDIIVKNGKNISPSELEQIAARNSDLLNAHSAAAIQIEGSIDGDIILFIEVREKEKYKLNNKEELIKNINQDIQKNFGVTLSKIFFLKRGELMKTSSGKIQRKIVANNYQKGYKFKEYECR